MTQSRYDLWKNYAKEAPTTQRGDTWAKILPEAVNRDPAEFVYVFGMACDWVGADARHEKLPEVAHLLFKQAAIAFERHGLDKSAYRVRIRSKYLRGLIQFHDTDYELAADALRKSIAVAEEAHVEAGFLDRTVLTALDRVLMSTWHLYFADELSPEDAENLFWEYLRKTISYSYATADGRFAETFVFLITAIEALTTIELSRGNTSENRVIELLYESEVGEGSESSIERCVERFKVNGYSNIANELDQGFKTIG